MHTGIWRILTTLLLLHFPVYAYCAVDVHNLIEHGGFTVKGKHREISYNANRQFIPASTVKILTSLVALQTLGSAYRFPTKLYLDTSSNLYIEGFGDPSLTSETLLDIGLVLKERGLREIQKIYLDSSHFALNGERANPENSLNPYDAPNGAIAVNFNSVPVKISQDRSISSGESQTPLLPIMVAIGKDLAPGNHRINVGSLSNTDQKTEPALRYAGELFTAQFKRAGIVVRGTYSNKKVPETLEPVVVYFNKKTVKETVQECLKYSNNFIANQLFLASGVAKAGAPATWYKSRKLYKDLLQSLLPDQLKQPVIQEGSGLSKKNRMSPKAIRVILEHFKPYYDLLPAEPPALLKSGTLTGVYCYAGYFREGKELAPFVIMLNQHHNNRDLILRSLFLALNK